MVVALALLVGAVVLALLAPCALAGGRWQVFRPRLALTAWFAAFGAGVAMAAGAFVASIVVAVTDEASASPSLVASLLAWGGVVALAAVLALASGASEPLVTSYRRSLRRLGPVAVSREDRGAFTLVRFVSEHPAAVAVPGRRPEILVSSALEEALTTAQLRCVVAHEYAHLRGHHGLLVRLAELNAACLPRFLPAGRELRKATVMLVELVADDVAARQAGGVQVAVALEELARFSGEPGFLVRAERLRALPGAGAVGVGLPVPVRL